MTDSKQLILIYFISVAVYGFIEMVLQVKFSGWKSTNRDKSFILVMIPFFLSIYLAPAEYLLLKPGSHFPLIIVGFIVLLLGVILRLWSMIILNKSFSVFIGSREDNKLVMFGPYRLIRHPLYLASIIMSISSCVIFSCVIVWIFVVLLISGVLVRIKKEEIFLSSQYPDYLEYMKRTKKLLPYLY